MIINHLIHTLREEKAKTFSSENNKVLGLYTDIDLATLIEYREKDILLFISPFPLILLILVIT